MESLCLDHDFSKIIIVIIIITLRDVSLNHDIINNYLKDSKERLEVFQMFIKSMDENIRHCINIKQISFYSSIMSANNNINLL